MDLRRYQPLHAAGATYKEIADEVGVDWRTVRKYLAAGAPSAPPAAPARLGTQPRKIDRLAPVVDRMLSRDLRLRASVIYERLVADYGFDGHYQRVKLYVTEARPRLAVANGDRRPLTGLHRRFEVTPGAQAQVDWGTEDARFAALLRVAFVYSFHMTLSFSRDPFCAFTTSMDLATFWACHVAAFEHFGGVPGAIVYDRTKTVVKRHVAPGAAVPLHPEAVAFADHYGFVIDVAAAHRPTCKGRVERQVLIVREHVLAGRDFASLAAMDAAFADWLPHRRAQIHRTHGEVIAVRAQPDRAALAPLPARPYQVVDRHLRRVGKDCLISFAASRYSVPAAVVTAGMSVELRVAPDRVAIHATGPDPVLLATHPRAVRRGEDRIDPAHWDGLPDGSSRATTVDPPSAPGPGGAAGPEQLAVVLAHRAKLATPVARRDPGLYDTAVGLTAVGTAEGGRR
ncbi:MAG: IS21 family transposase [Mycobacteriales bacterium]